MALGLLIASCSKKQDGQLVGSKGRPKWKGINPYGMVYIPSGTFHAGASDQDVSNTQMNKAKSMSIAGFFMDDTEITNNEYRQFIDWVRDSMAHALLDHYQESDDGNGKGIIDWKQDIDWTDETLNGLFYEGKDKFEGKRDSTLINS